MATIIKTLNDSRITVNGKTVYKDGSDNWVQSQELTTKETQDFQKHINAMEC